jgi:hypothetical protein
VLATGIVVAELVNALVKVVAGPGDENGPVAVTVYVPAPSEFVILNPEQLLRVAIEGSNSARVVCSSPDSAKYNAWLAASKLLLKKVLLEKTYAIEIAKKLMITMSITVTMVKKPR